jgi:hypothetical protein
MNTIILTDMEKNALLQLIDLAVKSAGLNVAEAAAVLARKISESTPPQPQSVEYIEPPVQ